MTKSGRRRSLKNRKPAGSGSQQESGLSVLHSDMKQLLEQQRQQEVRFVPEEKDVPRIRFRQNQLFNLEATFLQSLSTSTSAPTAGAVVVTLASLPNYTAFTAVFDRYRIIQVNVKIVPTSPMNTANPTFFTVLDYDDGNAPSALSTMLSYPTLKITPPGVIDERTYTPRLAAAAYSGTFASYANMTSGTWIDAASTGVQYYGMKYYSNSTASTVGYTLFVTCMMQFKSQRSGT